MKHSLNKKKLVPVICFALLSLSILFKGEYSQILVQLKSAHWGWLGIALIFIILYWVFEAKSLHLFIKVYDHHYSFFKTFKLVLSTQFFNGITPFSTGGQPFQVYALSQEAKFNLSHSTSLSTHNFIVYQTALVLLGSITLILGQFSNTRIYVTHSAGLFTMIGFALNLLVIILLCTVAYSSKLSHYILKTVLFIIKPFCSTEKRHKWYKKWKSIIIDFHFEIHKLFKNKRLFILTTLLNVFKLMSFYTIAYFILLSLGIHSTSFIKIVLASSYVMLITSMVPLPGASGGAEGGFFLIFGSFLIQHHIASVILLWRFITYYLGLIIGFVTYTFFHHKKNYA